MQRTFKYVWIVTKCRVALLYILIFVKVHLELLISKLEERCRNYNQGLKGNWSQRLFHVQVWDIPLSNIHGSNCGHSARLRQVYHHCRKESLPLSTDITSFTFILSVFVPSPLQASQLGVYRAFVDNYELAVETAEKCCQANTQFAEISEVRKRGKRTVGPLSPTGILQDVSVSKFQVAASAESHMIIMRY